MSTNHLKYRAYLTFPLRLTIDIAFLHLFTIMIGPSLLHGYTLNSTQVMPNILNKVLKPHAPIRSEHIVVGPGIGAILSHLIWHLCEAGDGVVITAVSGDYRSFLGERYCFSYMYYIIAFLL